VPNCPEPCTGMHEMPDKYATAAKNDAQLCCCNLASRVCSSVIILAAGKTLPDAICFAAGSFSSF